MALELENEHWSAIEAVQAEIQAFPGWRCAAVHLDIEPGYRYRAWAVNGLSHSWDDCFDNYQVKVVAIRGTVEEALAALPSILVNHIGVRQGVKP